MRFLRVAAPVLCVFLPLWAVETQVWEHSESADFEKGALRKLSLSSEGRLTAAPVLREIYDPSVPFLWVVVRDSNGNVYAGGGGVGSSKSKLIVVNAAGQAKTLAELDGMAIQALALDKQDRVYAATSPDGKVYRVDAAGQAEVFYDPHVKYIWALAFSSKGDLFVATGDQGEIHRVTATGAGSVFYRTEEAHVRSLAVDARDNLIAGTDPSGLILRISPAGEGFVLYEAGKREITTVAVAANGTVYAAGTGTKAPATAPAPAPTPQRQVQTSQGTVALAVPAGGPGRGGAGTAAPATGGGAPIGVQGGSEIYRVQPDGYARRIWTHPQDVVYALAFDTQGNVIAGTGNRGNIYRLDSDHTYTRMLNLAAAQVTGFAAGANGRLYAVTGNIGEIFSIGPEREPSGTLESDVLDAGAFSYWGRMTSLYAGSGAVTFETRSGNVSRAQKDWSPWAKLNGDRVASPAARFLQYRATVAGAAELYDVTAAYEMKNVAPVIEALETTPANYKFPAPVAAAAASPASLMLPALGRANPAPARPGADSGSSPALAWSKGHIGARWLANDENGDTLLFKIEIRGENEAAWKPLRENLRERYYSWDSTAYPDGKYRVRVTASDAPSNTPEQTLSSSRESDRFLIDNTAPEISGLSATVQGTKIEVHFHAKDAVNVLAKAEYSVDGGDWKVVEPTTRLTDSEEHDYRFQVDRGQGEAIIAVRVSDAYENEAVAKTVVK